MSLPEDQVQVSPTPVTKTTDTPVSQEELAQLGNLQNGHIQVANRIVELELEKVQLLRTITALQGQKDRIIETILTERGLPKDTKVEISAQTGDIRPILGSEEVFHKVRSTQTVPQTAASEPEPTAAA